MRRPYLSVVIPVFNEEAIIKDNVEKVVKFLLGKKYSWELIVVDDGSVDNSRIEISAFAKALAGKQNFRYIKHKKNLGKGAAVKTGMCTARGTYIIFMDADLSVPLGYIDDILIALKKSDVAIGSRRVEGAVIKKHQPIVRESMGRVFTKLTQVIMGVGVSDFTCGFKGFRREAAVNVFSKSRVARWAYDAEILFLAKRLGYKIVQVPVVWENRDDTRVRAGSAALEAFVDLIRIRYFDITGKYES